jgi:hypothetical protein
MSRLRKCLAYGGIAAGSLAIGAYEGISDIPGGLPLKVVVFGGIPIVSAYVGASTETTDIFGSDALSVFKGAQKGWRYNLIIGMGAIGGGGLSALCEAVGFGIGKVLS